MLLRAGAYIDSRDTFKATPLMRACEENNLEVAKVLISRGANLEAVQRDGCTALGIAAFKGRTKLVRLLINSKADIYLVSLRGQHPTQSPQVKDKIKRLFDHALLVRRLKYQSSLFLHLNYDAFVAQRTSTPRRVYRRIS
jgi:ankyrin repeat protein